MNYSGEWDHETQLKDMPKRTLRSFFESYRPDKMHLFALPTCKDDLNWQGTSKELCIVIPVFNITSNPLCVSDYILQSAIWSLRCWQQNTNARELEVPIYLYIEDTIIEENATILLNNGVPGNVVRSFTNRGFNCMAKKANTFLDKQFQDYKQVLVSDADMFPIKGNAPYHDILSRIIEDTELITEGIGTLCTEPITEPLETSRAAYWFKGRKYPQAWQDTVKQVCEPELAEIVISAYEHGVWIYPWMPLYLFSPKEIDAGQRETLTHLARFVLEDEFAISLLHEITSIGLYPLDARLDLHVIHDLLAVRFIAYTQLTKAVPTLLHASSSVDFHFQNLIGVHDKV
jgi:hypothetical protein